jgi:hypothetical protein
MILDFRFWILDLRSGLESRLFIETFSLKNQFKAERTSSRAKPIQNPKSKIQNLKDCSPADN